jgi:PAS domain S-box-containing protein
VTEGFRILFVHDDAAVRALASDALRREFPQVTVTPVGDLTALERALTSNGYDIAIADYSLQWGDGPAVFRSIKSRWPECPVVVFSVSGEDEALLRSMQGGTGKAPSGWPQFVTLLIVAVRSAMDKARLERERRESDDRLRESEARFRSVFESATDAIVLADPDGRIISWNRAAREIFGYSDDEVLGRMLTTLMPVRYRERHEAGMRHHREGLASRILGRTVEMFGLRKDGAEFPIELAVGTWETDRGRFYSGVIRDITRRKHDEEMLHRSNEDLRELSARIEAIQEEERTSIARELHDELGQALTVLRLDIAWLEKRVQEKPTDRARLLSRLRRMGLTVDSTIAEVRRISAELRPGMLDELGLQATVDWQIQEFTDRTGVACVLDSSIDESPVTGEAATAVFRILQECLTNIARHAGASRVEVTLGRVDGQLVLRVLDDGRGIEAYEARSPNALGLLGMKERCRSLSGDLTIEGQPGHGTRVTVRIPLGETASALAPRPFDGSPISAAAEPPPVPQPTPEEVAS